MRTITKPSTAKCNKDIYSNYLLCEPNNASCLKLADAVKNISHDSVNRFLCRENFNGHDLFMENSIHINLHGGLIAVDDSVIDKLYSNTAYAHLVDFYYSGKHHKPVKGINLVTLFHIDTDGVCLPLNFRVYNKKDGKTKNDYFRDMLDELITWGLRPKVVTGDSWYSGLMNLKHIRKHGLGFMFGIEKDRLISSEKGSYINPSQLDHYPEDGRIVYLKEFGNVKLFRQIYKEVYRYYIVGVANLGDLPLISYHDFKQFHDKHWLIETYHRALKQVCNIEKFQVRKTRAIKNHVFCSLLAFSKLEIMKLKQQINNWYHIQRSIFNEVIARLVKSSDIGEMLHA